jgi:UDP-GlcNAc:undecaprenyl-phosphate GlcNAc-1-phosphate transferase
MMMHSVSFTIVYMLIGWLLLQSVVRLLPAYGMLDTNFRGEKIPTGLGLFLGIMLWVFWFLSYLLADHEETLASATRLVKTTGGISFPRFVLCLTVLIGLGWIDDRQRDKSVKGLRGHWQKWAKEHVLTTGAWKAIGTFIVSCWVVLGRNDFWGYAAVQVLLVGLMTNTMNLLDMRPGRALKGYFVVGGGLLLISVVEGHPVAYFILQYAVAIGAMLIYPIDIRGRGMLGDTGANFLGFAVGCQLLISVSIWVQAVIGLLLIWIHVYAEQASITKFIAGRNWLHWLDQLGRANDERR